MNTFFIKKECNVKKINKSLIISLMPLLLYGFYKNGIKLYSNDLINFITMFKPLLFDMIGFIIGILVYYFYQKFIKKNNIKLLSSIFQSFYPFYGLLIASLVSINTNIFVFIILTLIGMMISLFIKKIKINVVAFCVLLIILVTYFISGFSYLNLYEVNNVLHLDPLDYFMGLGSGGINTTCGFLLVVSLIYLFTKSYYKKEILISSLVTYSIFMFFYCFFKTDLKLFLDSIFSNGVLFSFIYIATLSYFSPITTKGKIFFGVLVGIITFGLYLVYPSLATLGAIFIASLCSNTIDKLVER